MGFQPSRRGLGDLLVSPGMQAEMRARAERIAVAARASAPVGDPARDPDAGEYRDAFEVSSGVRQSPSRRAYGRVVNNSDHAAAVEYGNFRTRKPTISAQHVLGRALDAARDI